MKQYKLINDQLVQVPESCNSSCGPSDWYKGGKCDENGCYYERDLPAYSLSPEMKEWCKKNPKDSYPESDFKLMYERFIDGMNKWVKCEKVEYDAISWQLHKTHRRIVAVPIKPQNNKILSNENGI